MYKMLQKPESREDIVAVKQEKPKTVTRYPYQYSGKFPGVNARYYQNVNVPKHNQYESEPVVQRYIKEPRDHDKQDIIWDPGEKESFWKTVENGFEIATDRLSKVSQSDNEDENIRQWAGRMYNILNDDNLKIFPMVKPGYDALSACGILEISLEINALNKYNEKMAKTLIHEAFHIMGGCFKVVKGKLKYDPRLDTEEKSEDVGEIRQHLIRNSANILRIKADSVAQYMMLAGQ